MKILYTILFSLLSLSASAQAWPQPPALEPMEREIRAVWLCTLGGMDWPGRTYANTPERTEKQKADLCRQFDQLQAAGINVILFQTRIRGTVIYPSLYEPWDGAISGKPGVAPPYDPLAFAVQEAHKRGMELHAYVVAYPLCTVSQAKQLGKKSITAQHPELCQRCGDRWFMDPGMPGTAAYIAGICEEIVENYDVDGIHLDYIRYPEKDFSFNDNTAYRKYGNGMSKNQWKRDQVTYTVKMVHDVVKAIRPWVKISCSPVGKYADLPRANSYGWNARDAVFQDAQLWLEKNYMDWLFPMMYFDGKHFYPFAANWQQESYGHPVIPGLGIYFLSPREKDWDLVTITRQMNVLRQLGIGGQAFFRSQFLLENQKGLYDFCKNFYRQPALTPPMTWVDNNPPAAPNVKTERDDKYIMHLTWNAVKDASPIVYNIYRKTKLGDIEMIAHHLKATHFDYAPYVPAHINDSIFVKAMDAYGNESL